MTTKYFEISLLISVCKVIFTKGKKKLRPSWRQQKFCEKCNIGFNHKKDFDSHFHCVHNLCTSTQGTFIRKTVVFYQKFPLFIVPTKVFVEASANIVVVWNTWNLSTKIWKLSVRNVIILLTSRVIEDTNVYTFFYS